jgi:hypothetical protein
MQAEQTAAVQNSIPNTLMGFEVRTTFTLTFMNLASHI